MVLAKLAANGQECERNHLTVVSVPMFGFMLYNM